MLLSDCQHSTQFTSKLCHDELASDSVEPLVTSNLLYLNSDSELQQPLGTNSASEIATATWNKHFNLQSSVSQLTDSELQNCNSHLKQILPAT